MSHATAEMHRHTHGPGCGHESVIHESHVDYLHDGHMHSEHGDHYDEHTMEVSSANPDACNPVSCAGQHQGEDVPHGDHTDTLVNGHLHHRHGDHCDDHGAVTTM